jgi:hypothetical protein
VARLQDMSARDLSGLHDEGACLEDDSLSSRSEIMIRTVVGTGVLL